MKLARTLLAVLTLSVLTACADSVTAPQAQPDAPAAQGESVCFKETLADGTVVSRCTGHVGSGG